jgi:hypothetical protein
MRQFWSIDPANEQRLCWNLNALLQKIGGGNRGEITISWMVKPVTDGGDRPPQIVAKCCSFVPLRPPRPLPTPLAHHERATSPAAAGRRLRDRTAGRKIAPLHKKQSGR